MFLLAENTDVPKEHAGWVRTNTLNDWLPIGHSAQPPTDSVVWVHYNDYFFCTAQSDLRSKDAFALVRLLFALQAGDIGARQPVRTLALD